MACKTVLAHCNDKARVRRVLGPAVEVAGAFQAHLVGLSITPPIIIVPAGMSGTPESIMVDEHCQAYRAARRRARGVKRCLRCGPPSERSPLQFDTFPCLSIEARCDR